MFLPRGHHILLQYLATLTANLLNFMHGLSIAWFIATGNTFHTNATPLQVPPITRNEVKWIDSSLYVGGLVGVIFLTLMGDGFGRKNTLAVMIFPQLGCWSLILLATNATEVYIGRFVAGFIAGGTINLTLLFVAELADDRIRGRLHSILPLSIHVGTLTGLLVSYFDEAASIAWVAFGAIVLLLCTFTIFPDTPQQLYKINKKEEAIKSLQIYRDIRDLECQTDDCYQIETKKIRKTLLREIGFMSLYEKRPLLRSILISIALIILNGCTMHFVSHSLTNSTWFSSNPNDSHILRILTAVLQLTVGLITTFSIDFIDRKKLLLFSTIGLLVVQSLHVANLFINQFMTSYPAFDAWIPIVCLVLVNILWSCGIFPSTFVLIPEIVPSNIRIYLTTTLFAVMWLFSFVLSQCEDLLIAFHAVATIQFWICSMLVTGICIVVFAVYIPKTTRKSYDDINARLRGLEGIDR